jgi:hypothetical protein
MLGEAVSNRDKNWLARYDESLMLGTTAQFDVSSLKDESTAQLADEKQADAEFMAEEEIQSEHELEGEIADIES